MPRVERRDYFETLTAESVILVDTECRRFEAALQSGQTPRIECFLDSVSQSERSAPLQRLLFLELDFRKKQGQPFSREEYLQRFPENAGAIDAAFDRSAQRDKEIPPGKSIRKFLPSILAAPRRAAIRPMLFSHRARPSAASNSPSSWAKGRSERSSWLTIRSWIAMSP